MVERKTGFLLIHKVERKTALAVSDAMTKLLKPESVNRQGQLNIVLLKKGLYQKVGRGYLFIIYKSLKG